MCILNLAKIKFGKKWNLQAPWGMEDFTLPSVRARFKRLERKLSKGFSQNSLSLLPTFLGWCKSTLAGWLQHMPALPKLLLKFSNIHNFWSIGPKIMKFVLPQSLFRGTCSQKVSKKPKIEGD
jgi:hypothetical protein